MKTFTFKLTVNVPDEVEDSSLAENMVRRCLNETINLAFETPEDYDDYESRLIEQMTFDVSAMDSP